MMHAIEAKAKTDLANHKFKLERDRQLAAIEKKNAEEAARKLNEEEIYNKRINTCTDDDMNEFKDIIARNSSQGFYSSTFLPIDYFPRYGAPVTKEESIEDHYNRLLRCEEKIANFGYRVEKYTDPKYAKLSWDL
jgi:hypothetical protein